MDILARSTASSRRIDWPAWLPALSGICVALLAVRVGVGWYMHWESYIKGVPGPTSMKFNAAVCFLLAGIGFALITTSHKRVVTALAATAAAIGAATLVEYATGRALGIDQLLMWDYLTPANDFPGRMSPLTATCFVLLGAGLLSSGVDSARPWTLGGAGASACLISLIAVVALGGYLGGIEATYGWGAYTRMAVFTALSFLVLGLSLLTWVSKLSRLRGFELARWLPLAGSTTLMAVAALLAITSVRELRMSYDTRKNAYETLTSAQTLLGSLTDIQRGMRGYVLTGQPASLNIYNGGVDLAPKIFIALKQLTADNTHLQSLLSPLTGDFDRAIDYSHRLLALRDNSGLQAAAELESTGEGLAVASQVRTDLQAFTDAMHQLLLERDAKAEQTFRSTTNLLVLSSVLASVMLMFAHLVAVREAIRRKRTEEKFNEVSALQAAILKSANYAVISTSVAGTVTTMNATAERWLGYAAVDIVGKASSALWHDPNEIAEHASALSHELGVTVIPGFDSFTAKARMGTVDEHEWSLIRKDGSRFPAWLSSSALTDTRGHITGFLGVIADITERKRQEAELRSSEEQFRRAFDDAPIGMALMRPDGAWLKVNHALCHMLGYSETELLSIRLQSITYPDDLKASFALGRDLLSGKRLSGQIEDRFFQKQGQVMYAMVSASLVRDDMRAPLHFVVQFENISERRAMERLKRDFVATVSHELRTPLTSIRGALGLLTGGAFGVLPEKMASMVGIAHKNSERLVLIINDILDIEKIEAGKIHVELSSVAVAAFLKEALAANQVYAEKCNVTLELEALTPELEVMADPDRLMQVITNLLSNAAKFSAAGTTVQVRALSSGGRVRFEVEDHGAGISAEFRGRIFEKFAQADSSTGRHFAGTGLGLAISKSLVERMQGTIGFESRVNVGTTFFVELPSVDGAARANQDIQPSEAERLRKLILNRPAPAGELGRHPRVLHVEDDNDLTAVLQASLVGQAEVVGARTVAIASNLLGQESFAAVVLDAALPDGDGLALLDQIQHIFPRPPPVVILSVTEIPLEVRRRVAATLIKSRISESDVAQTILAVIYDRAA